MISVIVGVYNNEKTIQKALISVLEGTYQDIEVIVCDDCSKDQSKDKVKELMNKYSNLILIENEENHGLSFCLNRCLKKAKGEYIARLDGDDYCCNDRLKKQLEYLQSHPNLSFVCSNAYLFDYKNGVYGIREYDNNVDLNLLIKYNPFIHPTMLIKKECIEKIKGYSNELDVLRCEDYDLFFNLYFHHFQGANINDELYYYYEDSTNLKKHSIKVRINEYKLRKRWYKKFNLGFKQSLFRFKPIILIFIPKFIYRSMHKKYCKKIVNK